MSDANLSSEHGEGAGDTGESGLGSEQTQIEDVARRLKLKYPSVNGGYIDGLVQSEYATLKQARLREYIAVLVEHTVKQQIRQDQEKMSDLL